MSAMKPKSKPAQRTTNAEMSAQSRGRIVAATMSSLAEVGYAGTTMSGIAERVGLTRAALIYHFENKYVLMAAVANAIYDEMGVRFREAAPASLNPRERIFALLDASYAMTDSVIQMALIELLLAARRDPACRAEVAPTIEQRDQGFNEVWHAIVEGATDHPERMDLLRDFSVSVFRGMTICRSLSADISTFDQQNVVLRRLIQEVL
jgi:AcrR family transcriptional regulator